MRFLFRTIKRRVRRRAVKPSRTDYIQRREEARIRIMERLSYWKEIIGVSYNRVAIRNQGTRWGSCSKKGNLNFNYKIAFLAPELMDYVIVHELCHLVHFNHSTSFWNLVGAYITEYQKCRKELLLIAVNTAFPTPTPMVEV